MVRYPDYDNSILNVTTTILKHYHAESIYQSISVLEEELAKNYKHIVLILLDGMGVNVIGKLLEPTAFLRKNIKKAITSVFPPTTVAATNTVLSGLPPYASGYLGWVQYFAKEDTNNIVLFNEDYYDKTVKIKSFLKDKYLSYPTIYEQIKKRSPDVKTHELFPGFRENGFKSFKEQTKRIKEITKEENRTFTYAYWTEPDLTQHSSGIYAAETKIELNKLNKDMENLANSINDETLLIVIADHGLTDVKGIDLFSDFELLQLLKRKPSIEPRAANFFVKQLKKKKFKQLFNAKYGDSFMLLTKKELYSSKLLGYGKKHKLIDRFLGDYLAIATSDLMFNFKKDVEFEAHHAGLTKDEMEVPLIFYSKR